MLPKTILEPSQMHYEQGSMVTPDDEFQWTFSRRHINICNNNFGKSPSSSAPFSFYNLEICFLLLLLPLSSAAVGKAVLSSSPTPFFFCYYYFCFFFWDFVFFGVFFFYLLEINLC